MPQPTSTPEVEAPVGRQSSLPPRDDRRDGSSEDQEPRGDVEEAIGKRVRFESRDRGRGVLLDVADHVVPLKDLMQHDAVDEAAEPEPVENTGDP